MGHINAERQSRIRSRIIQPSSFRRRVTATNLHRISVGVDQAVYSISSFLATVIVARASSIDQFGQFSIVFTIIVLVVGLQRAAVVEPLIVVLGSRGPSPELLRAACWRSAGFCVAAAVCGATWVWIETGDWAVATLGASLAGPFMQDLVRYLLYLKSESLKMVISDGVSGACQVSTLIILSSAHVGDAYLYMCGFALAAIAGPIFMSRSVAKKCQAANSADDLKSYGRLNLPFGSDYLLGVLSLQGTFWAATTLAGPAASAALRGSDSLIGPARVVLQTLPALLLRRWSDSVQSRAGAIAKFGGVLWIGASLGAICAWALPAKAGVALLGQSWSVVSPVLPFVVLSLAPITVTFICSLAIKASGHSRVLLYARFVSTPITLTLGVSGAVLGGARGAAIGSFFGSCLAAGVFMLFLVLLERNAR